MIRLALAVLLSIGLTGSQGSTQQKAVDPARLEIRFTYFDPRSAEFVWIDVFKLAGKGLACSEHPDHPGESVYLRGAYLDHNGVSLEYDVRLECESSFGESILQPDSAYVAFIGEKVVAPATIQSISPPQSRFPNVPYQPTSNASAAISTHPQNNRNRYWTPQMSNHDQALSRSRTDPPASIANRVQNRT